MTFEESDKATTKSIKHNANEHHLYANLALQVQGLPKQTLHEDYDIEKAFKELTAHHR